MRRDLRQADHPPTVMAIIQAQNNEALHENSGSIRGETGIYTRVVRLTYTCGMGVSLEVASLFFPNPSPRVILPGEEEGNSPEITILLFSEREVIG